MTPIEKTGDQTNFEEGMKNADEMDTD